MTPSSLTTTTLPVGLVRDLEAALARPGTGVVKVVLATDGRASVRDCRTPQPDRHVPPPCPRCSTAMSSVEGRFLCPACRLARTPRSYRRLTRLLLTSLGSAPCPS